MCFLMCIPSLDTGVTQNIPLKVPSNVVEGSARATLSVLGKCLRRKETAVQLCHCSHDALPPVAKEALGNRHWMETAQSRKMHFATSWKGGSILVVLHLMS